MRDVPAPDVCGVFADLRVHAVGVYEGVADRVHDVAEALFVGADARGDGVALRAPLLRDLLRGLRRRAVTRALDDAAVGAEPDALGISHPPTPRAAADEPHVQRGILVVHLLSHILRLGAASPAHVEPIVGLLERLGAAHHARDALEVRHLSPVRLPSEVIFSREKSL